MNEQESPPTLRMLGHPLHPLGVHFALALLGVTPLWDTVALMRPETYWWQFAYWSITVGLLAVVPAAFTGFLDYAAIPRGHPALRIANRHLVIMLTAAGVFAVNLLLRLGSTPPAGVERTAAVLLSWAGLLLLMTGGWHGGELVYGHGIGRRAPEDGQEGSRAGANR